MPAPRAQKNLRFAPEDQAALDAIREHLDTVQPAGLRRTSEAEALRWALHQTARRIGEADKKGVRLRGL